MNVREECPIVKKGMTVSTQRDGVKCYEPYVIINKPVLWGLFRWNFKYKLCSGIFANKHSYLQWIHSKPSIFAYNYFIDEEMALKILEEAIASHYNSIQISHDTKVEIVEEIEIKTTKQIRNNRIENLLNK
jgi:hypothetical protein